MTPRFRVADGPAGLRAELSLAPFEHSKFASFESKLCAVLGPDFRVLKYLVICRHPGAGRHRGFSVYTNPGTERLAAG